MAETVMDTQAAVPEVRGAIKEVEIFEVYDHYEKTRVGAARTRGAAERRAMFSPYGVHFSIRPVRERVFVADDGRIFLLGEELR